jgi:hypothetical protein
MDGQQSEKREKFEKEIAAHPFLLGMNEQHVRLLADCAIHSHFYRRNHLSRRRSRQSLLSHCAGQDSARIVNSGRTGSD